MRALSFANLRRPAKMLPCATALFTMLALMSVNLSPVLSVSAKETFSSSQTAMNGVPRPEYDFIGDIKTDFTTLVIGATGTSIQWRVQCNPVSPLCPPVKFFYGLSGDSITAGDYVGDAKTDASVWRSGTFYHSAFPYTSPFTIVNWGNPTGENLGRVGNYDVANTKDDETVVRVVLNVLQWHIRGSQGTNRVTPFGQITAGVSTLAFQGADFTGDGRDEIVICQVTNATGAAQWLIGDSITGNLILSVSFGNFNTDFFLNPDDYTGDSIADIPTWRAGGAGADAGAWYIRNTATGALVPAVIFGISDPAFVDNDLPLRGDYDGDGIADKAVFRPTNNTWYWIKSSDGLVNSQEWGDTNEIPLPNFFTF